MLIVMLCIPSKVFAEFDVKPLSVGNKHFTAELILDRQVLQPTKDSNAPAAKIGILITPEENWHSYWKNSGEAAAPTRVIFNLPNGWRADEVNWPIPEKIYEKDTRITYGYKNQFLLWANLYTPDVIPNETQNVKLSAQINLLICKDICIPGTQKIDLEIPFSETLPEQVSKYSELFESLKDQYPNKKVLPEDLLVKPFKVEISDSFFLGFEITKKIANEGLVQIFPYLESGIKVVNGYLLNIEENKTLIYFQTDKSNIKKKEISFVIAFSKEAFQTKNDINLEFNVDLSNIESRDINFSELAKGAKALTYKTIGKTIAVNSENTTNNKAGGSQTTLLVALLSAFIGGMILNLMPCVLPIISIKIISFVSQSQKSKKELLYSSLSFAIGILFTFFALSLIVISLKSLGSNIGWGFQFQYPEFVFALLIIVFFLSLSFFDLYSLSLPFLNSANVVGDKLKGNFAKNFFDGVLATALSTPCTAPFLGTALVFAFAQSTFVTVLLFQAIGLGLAFPYVYFSSRPGLLKLLPAPGNWMYSLRQFMGFLLLGTVCWLLFILNDLTQIGALWSLVILLILYFCVWATKIITESSLNEKAKFLFQSLLIVLLLLTAYLNYPKIIARKGQKVNSRSSIEIPWVEYSKEAIVQAKSENKAVFIDFTASWCITCKFNEFRVINTEETLNVLSQNGILAMKADWTDGNEKVTEALKNYGAEGVPLYVIIPKGRAEPIILSTLPSQASLSEALMKAVQ